MGGDGRRGRRKGRWEEKEGEQGHDPEGVATYLAVIFCILEVESFLLTFQSNTVASCSL